MREKAAEGRGLYRPEFEHDACGIGAVVDIQGRASHETVDDALKIVEKLEHRAGKDAEGKTGDGWHTHPDPPRVFCQGGGGGEHRPARTAGLRRGHVLPASGRFETPGRPRDSSNW